MTIAASTTLASTTSKYTGDDRCKYTVFTPFQPPSQCTRKAYNKTRYCYLHTPKAIRQRNQSQVRELELLKNWR